MLVLPLAWEEGKKDGEGCVMLGQQEANVRTLRVASCIVYWKRMLVRDGYGIACVKCGKNA